MAHFVINGIPRYCDVSSVSVSVRSDAMLNKVKLLLDTAEVTFH